MIRRVLVFADDYGMPMLLRHLPSTVVAGIVVASIRPAQHVILARCAGELGVPLLVQPKRDSPEYSVFVERVREIAPEFLMVNSYSMRIGVEILRLAPAGGINVHGALLPGFRGANPIQWALIEDARETGVTMHELTEDIDAGAIVAQRKVPILFRDTWRDIQDRVAQSTETLLSDTLPSVLNQNSVAVPQRQADARHFKRRTPDDGKIDWANRVLDIYNLIRALVEPHPGAFYDSPAGRVWIRRHMSIQEVAALKYSVLGEPPIAIGDIRFWPSQGHPEAGTGDTFSLQGTSGLARLVSIDWEKRVARMDVSVELPQSNSSQILKEAVIEFSRTQLGLNVASDSSRNAGK